MTFSLFGILNKILICIEPAERQNPKANKRQNPDEYNRDIRPSSADLAPFSKIKKPLKPLKQEVVGGCL